VPRTSKVDSAKQIRIKNALDEIEHMHDRLGKSRVTEDQRKAWEGWIRKQKALLKSLGYTGPIPRKPRIDK